MPYYYVNDNAQLTGEHEVHESGCSWLSLAASTTSLGYHENCLSAVQAARRVYRNVDGCKHCIPLCHSK